MKKILAIFVYTLIGGGAEAGAFIDPSDYGSGGDWRTAFGVAGLFAEMTCREHKKLIEVGVTETVQPIAKWFFRIGVLLLLGQIVGGVLGLNWTMADVGFKLLCAWAVLRSAQALYLSGCDRIMKEGDRIKQKLADQDLHT